MQEESFFTKDMDIDLIMRLLLNLDCLFKEISGSFSHFFWQKFGERPFWCWQVQKIFRFWIVIVLPLSYSVD